MDDFEKKMIKNEEKTQIVEAGSKQIAQETAVVLKRLVEGEIDKDEAKRQASEIVDSFINTLS